VGKDVKPHSKASARKATGELLPTWQTPEGTPVACAEKIKVLNENILEIREMCAEALADAVLMGCDERQMRAVLLRLVRTLEEPFKD
jgi:hypothetical protein